VGADFDVPGAKFFRAINLNAFLLFSFYLQLLSAALDVYIVLVNVVYSTLLVN
jgi:hypothetical protein